MEEAYRKPIAEVLLSLRTSKIEGLSEEEAERRLQEAGYNELPREKPYRIVFLFLDRFRDVLVIILLLAGAISLALGQIGDAIIIAIAIFLDTSLSFFQAWRTENTLEQMRKKVEDTTTVIRSGKPRYIPSKYLVPGDIIEFRAGERIPADGRLVRSSGLKTQEAALTGESSDVTKDIRPLTRAVAIADRRNMVYAGTIAVAGSGTAVIAQTATHTELGKIAQLLRVQHSPVTPLRQKLQRTGMQIGFVIIAAIALLAIIGIWQGATLMDTFHTAITLIVSAIPEDLTMILTIALTVGVRRILKQGGAVRTLNSGETLGSATVICTDKTGTLTEGNMRATGLHFLQGDVLDEFSRPKNEFHKLAYIGISISSDAHRIGTTNSIFVGSATERTGLAFAEEAGFTQNELRKLWRVRDTITFSTEWKYRACLADHPTQATQTLFVVGAPDILLERSSETLDEHNRPAALNSHHRALLQEKITTLASQGKRLVAVGVRRNLHQKDLTHADVHNLLFLGVLTIVDPIRHEVTAAIKETIAAGVQVKLVTGDHRATALAVAQQIGLPANRDTCITGEEMQSLSDKELSETIEHLTVFARVEPLDKQRIVRLLQKRGHVVAMTGDGINDAIALKGANIGVAVQTGSDVAREAADLVLLNNSFATIVAAIKEGRVLRDNIRKVIAFLLATNAAEVAIFFVSLVFGLPLPLLPAQILWINLVTDGTSDIALSLEPAEDNVMKRKPEDPERPLLGKMIASHIVFSGIVMTCTTMLVFWSTLRQTQDLVYARTIAFTLLSVTSLLSVWSFRSLKQGIIKRGFWQNPWILVSSGFSLALQMIALYVPAFRAFFGTVPLGAADWLMILAVAIPAVIIVDARKHLLPHHLKRYATA